MIDNVRDVMLHRSRIVDEENHTVILGICKFGNALEDLILKLIRMKAINVD